MTSRIFREDGDRTGTTWKPWGTGFDMMEAFVVTGPPIVRRFGGRRELVHPVVHLGSGGESERREFSRSDWIRKYVQVA